MKKVNIGIDLSMRSTGIVLTNKNKIIHQYIYQNKENNHVKLLIEIRDYIRTVFKFIQSKYIIGNINLEGLSLNSESTVLDVISTNNWNVRMVLYELNLKYTMVAAREWRKYFDIQGDKKIKEHKKELGSKFWKILTFNKLDKKSSENILNFCSDNNLVGDSRFDLADAYFISRFEK